MLRVPLILRYPGSAKIRSGSRVTRPVSTVDILPTLIELLGLPEEAGLAGRSLLEADPGASPLYARLAMDGHRQDAVVAPPWKLIVDIERNERRLYDLAVDPGEQHPLDPATDSRAAAALVRLESEWMRVSQSGNAVEIRKTTEDVDLPEHLRQPLEALGYIER